MRCKVRKQTGQPETCQQCSAVSTSRTRPLHRFRAIARQRGKSANKLGRLETRDVVGHVQLVIVNATWAVNSTHGERDTLPLAGAASTSVAGLPSLLTGSVRVIFFATHPSLLSETVKSPLQLWTTHWLLMQETSSTLGMSWQLVPSVDGLPKGHALIQPPPSLRVNGTAVGVGHATHTCVRVRCHIGALVCFTRRRVGHTTHGQARCALGFMLPARRGCRRVAAQVGRSTCTIAHRLGRHADTRGRIVPGHFREAVRAYKVALVVAIDNGLGVWGVGALHTILFDL